VEAAYLISGLAALFHATLSFFTFTKKKPFFISSCFLGIYRNDRLFLTQTDRSANI
jgi:hypothetical protein